MEADHSFAAVSDNPAFSRAILQPGFLVYFDGPYIVLYPTFNIPQ